MRDPHQAAAAAGRQLRVVERGFVRWARPGTRQAFITYPTVVALSDGRLLATCRPGSAKDAADETTELSESQDGGRTWQPRPFPAPALVNGRRGSSRSCHLTEVAPGHLLAAAMWVDRETYPGKPLFNPETEGCLPTAIVLADSYDAGENWSAWRVVPVPEEIGPPSLTTAVLRLKDGTLALSIESNKAYLDTTPWLQKAVLLHSTDGGRTWGPPVVAGCDPTGRIFNWDQRAAVAPDGRVAAFLWIYDTRTHAYLNLRRRVSPDGGHTWSPAEDLGFADQPGHPAILPDGGVVLPYVDRFGSQCIRARWAPDVAAAFDPETDVVVFAHQAARPTSAHTGATTDALVDTSAWSYGLPYAETLPDGDILVVYYAGSSHAMDACWARLGLR
jgi:hypothetical protein